MWDNGLVGIALIPPDGGHSYLVATAREMAAPIYTRSQALISACLPRPLGHIQPEAYASRAPMSHLTKYERMTIERKARKRLKSKRSWGTR